MPTARAAQPAQTSKSRASTARRRRLDAPLPDPGGVWSSTEQIMRFRRPMTVEELAPILGRSNNTLHRMVRNELIPAIKIPGSKLHLFDPATICRWLCRHNPKLLKAS